MVATMSYKSEPGEKIRMKVALHISLLFSVFTRGWLNTKIKNCSWLQGNLQSYQIGLIPNYIEKTKWDANETKYTDDSGESQRETSRKNVKWSD